ncbi:MAG: NPCBM/NEW2 domain-containing protein [Planctomycetes bacterium]|nr:NPCBM/NEW2 domain-containing protein [Planctomycetota bacterium]
MRLWIAVIACLVGFFSCRATAQFEARGFIREPRPVTAEVPRPAEASPTVELKTDRGVLALCLSLVPMRTPDAVCLVDNGRGMLTSAPLPAPATWRGVVRDYPRSVVAAAVVAGGLRAVIDLGEGPANVLYVQPARELGLGEGHVMYAAADAAPGDWRCGVVEPAQPTPAPAGYGPRACAKVAEIAFDADYEMFLANGESVANTVADIESVLIANDVIYLRDVGIGHQSTAFVIRATPADPYTATDAGGLLDQFRAEWETNRGGIRRDIAHLMTGREVDGNIIGVAYVSVVCSNFSYGLSQSRFTAQLVYRVGLTAHELGHNWSASHCDGDADCSIMCSGIGGCAQSVTAFSSRTISEVTSFRDIRSCLSVGVPVAYDDSYQSLPGQSVRMDVLGNDSDAGCGVITMPSFQTSTAGGGLVTRSVGTGPNGRDELLYQPRAGFSGLDSFTYQIRVGAGSPATGTVRVEVVTPRAPDAVGLTGPGLDAAYYLTLPLSVAELPRGTVVGTATSPTINFPSSSTNIAGGSRHDGVGMILTGTLQIPAAGTYTFYCASDDGSVLYVNNSLVVMNDGPQGFTEVAGTISLPAGPASVRLEYFQGGGDAGLLLSVLPPGFGAGKVVVPAAWWTAPGVSITFLDLGGLYDNLPDLSTLNPVRRGVVTDINQANFDQYFAGSTRREHVAAGFNGYIVVPTTGFYRFYTTSDDASTLSIGDRTVVSNLGLHGMVEQSGVIALAAGMHAMRIEFFQGGGGGGLIASIEGPGIAKQAIPPSMLARSLPDCNGDGINDAAQVVTTLDMGDILVGGNGLGTGVVGSGINPATGVLINSPSTFGGNRSTGASIFQPLNGQFGRANIPMIAGVFVPNGTTTIATGRTFRFSTVSGGYWDCMRNGAGPWDTGVPSLVLADQNATPRKGVGMHANSGFTIDLAAVRTANPGRSVLRATGVAGLNRDSCAGRDAAAEFYVLVDGVVAYHTICTDDALAQQFDVALSGSARYLSLAMLEATSNNCDHFAVADARLILDAAADADHDGILDSCQCVADFNQDGGVDGADVDAFFSAWQNSLQEADTNHDGGVDGSDVETFFQHWQGGDC